MSSTGNSNTPFRWFEAISIKAKKLPVPPSPESDPWETVDFPNMVSVAAIPQDGTAPVNPTLAPTDPVTEAIALLASTPTGDDLGNPLELSQPQPELAPFAPLVADLAPMTLDPAIAPMPKPVSEPVVASSEPLTSVKSTVEVAQENEQLRLQLAELEGALARSQAILRTETERWQAKSLTQSTQETQRFQQQSVQLTQQSQALAVSQAQIIDQVQELHLLRKQTALQTQELLTATQQLAHLTPDLEQVTQTSQRQQILVETLTVQLNASQSQVAQLERECSLQQQRYSEQVQLTLQAESACKDLRSRLNRQQRYTLQFKAALEKCLEVPAAQGFAHLALSQHSDSELMGIDITTTAPLFIPKAQPVRPWSAQPDFLAALPLPRDDHQDWSVDAADAVLASTQVPEPSEPIALTDRIAPRIATGRTIGPIELPQMFPSAPLFTESDANLTDATFAEVASLAATPTSVVSLENQAENVTDIDLWATDRQLTGDDGDLTTTAIEDDAATLDLSLEPEAIDSEGPPATAPTDAEANWINRFKRVTEPVLTSPDAADNELVASGISESDASIVPLPTRNLLAPAAAEKSVHSAQRLSPFITLADAPVLVEVATAGSAAKAAPLFYANGPSPVIYPLRPTKKLPSLAAVQLPSFPRSGR